MTFVMSINHMTLIPSLVLVLHMNSALTTSPSTVSSSSYWSRLSYRMVFLGRARGCGVPRGLACLRVPDILLTTWLPVRHGSHCFHTQNLGCIPLSPVTESWGKEARDPLVTCFSCPNEEFFHSWSSLTWSGYVLLSSAFCELP